MPGTVIGRNGRASSCCREGGRPTPCRASAVRGRRSSTSSSSTPLTSSWPCSAIAWGRRRLLPCPDVEEIRLAHAAGKPVHVWFSEEPIPRGADLQQVQAVKEYREALAAEGLYGSFTSPEDLAAKVRQAIENDLAGLDLGVAQRPLDVQSGALLRARHKHDREPHQDRRGRVTYRSRNHRPIVRNTGTASAAQVTLNLSAPEENGSPPFLHDPSPPPTILPGGEFAWPLMMTNNTSRQCRVTMTWQEGEEERSEVQDVSL